MSTSCNGETNKTVLQVFIHVRARLDTAAQSSINASVGPNKSNKWDWGETVEKLREASDELHHWARSVNLREISARNDVECERICAVLEDVSELLLHCEFMLGLSKEISPDALRHDCFSALCYKIHGLRYPINSLDGLADLISQPPHTTHTASPPLRGSPFIASVSPASPSASPASYEDASAYTKQPYHLGDAEVGGEQPSHLRKDSHVAPPTTWRSPDDLTWRSTLPSFAMLEKARTRSEQVVVPTSQIPMAHHTPILPPLPPMQDSPSTASLSSPPSPPHISIARPPSLRLDWDHSNFTAIAGTSPSTSTLPRILHPPLIFDGPITPQLEMHFRTDDRAFSDWGERRYTGNSPGSAGQL